jgi:hypothetical protein
VTARQIILGGLLLPLRLYFQPAVFREQVASLAPDLPWHYSLWQARRKLRDPDFRRGLGQLALQSAVALLWSPLLAFLVAAALVMLGLEVEWFRVVFYGVVGGVALGVVVGAAWNVLWGVAWGVAWGMAGSIAGSVAFSVAGGTAWGVAGGTAWGVAWGAAFGVAWGVALGVAWSLAKGTVVSMALGVALGVALWVAGSAAVGKEGGAALGVAGGAASVLVTTHVLNLPLHYFISLASWLLARLSPRLSPKLWRFSPVRWDEVILLPLPGLAGLLVELYHADSTLGREALVEVAAHRYRHRQAYHALVQLAQEEARRVTSAPALAAFGRELGWLSEDTPLSDDVRALVFGMRDVGREVASALESDSATNCVRRLETAAGMLEILQLHPGEFGLMLANWSVIVSDELEKARRRQREEEPIPRVYVSDGRPVRPAERAELALPFKGRAALFRQLEAALGGPQSRRATLLLYGQRRTGKTSVLLHLPRRLGSRMVPAFIDLQSEKLGGAKDVAGLLGGLADEVVEEARRHRGVSLPALNRKTFSDDPYPAFGTWLDGVERALDERTLLLCLDEFEELERGIQDGRLDARFPSMLRNVVQHRGQVAVLLSGSHQIEELSPRWASALITTTTLPISFLDGRDARELIEQPVADFPAIYTPAAVDRIVEATHCQPFLIQLTCALLIERMNTARRVPPESFVEPADVDTVIPLVLERGQNYFIDLWHNQAGSDVARRVLEALACAHGTQMDRAELRKAERDERALRDALATLLRREIVERADGDAYRITVPIVAEYARRQVLV